MLQIINTLNTSKLLVGVCMIMFNIGSKYILIDLSKSQEQLLKSFVLRRITLFCIFFVATRDLVVSFVLTASFVVLAFNLFNEDSKYNIMPKSFFDTVYTLEEYQMAKTIIVEYEKAHEVPKYCKQG
tara:strand:+ start:3006 stop:3386 length:381 start_codon:yes stop_codon:yes gene_type:complete